MKNNWPKSVRPFVKALSQLLKSSTQDPSELEKLRLIAYFLKEKGEQTEIYTQKGQSQMEICVDQGMKATMKVKTSSCLMFWQDSWWNMGGQSDWTKDFWSVFENRFKGEEVIYSDIEWLGERRCISSLPSDEAIRATRQAFEHTWTLEEQQNIRNSTLKVKNKPQKRRL